MKTAKRIDWARVEIIADCDPDTSYLEQDGWEDALESYRSGAFGFVGVRAVAQYAVKIGSAWKASRVSSCGLWGIEDHSGKDYMAEVADEELAMLAVELRAIGFGARAVAVAVDAAETVDAGDILTHEKYSMIDAA